MMKKTLIASCVLAVLVFAAPALAGPPFVCHPFEIGVAKSLPWGDIRNYLGMRDDYDFRAVVADTEKLLTPATPTLVRMETLRRASIYASRDRVLAEQLIAAMMARVSAAEKAGQPMALALFDAGYVVEALTEMQEVGRLSKQLAGLDRVLAGVTQSHEARPLIERALALRPDDASMELALGLISRTPESETHFAKARTASREDALLANNLARLQLQ